MPGVAFKGMVHGGQNPIQNAHVYLYAIANGGYGTASTSLLTAASNTAKDGNGNYYVTTDANGDFTITGDYACGSPSHYYLYSTGGNPGSGTNIAATLMASLGSCSVPNFSSLYAVVNEVSTIATAYAFAGYATNGTSIASANTALAGAAVNYASFTVQNLETLATGTALATTPAGNGTVPQAEIDTLANILAACINSSGAVTGPTSPTPCYTLFTNALSGGATGTQPTDTATAAINIAHNPGANISNLTGLSTANAPFQPSLSATPNDLTIAISYTGGGLNSPLSLAVDGSGNVWVTNGGNNTVSKINGGTGAAISPAGGYTAGGLTSPFAIAIDQSGNAWVANLEVYNFLFGTETSPPSVTELTSAGAGATGSPFTGGGVNLTNQGSPRNVAIDASGNVWIANASASLTELNGTNGAAISPATTGFPLSSNSANPSGVAVDSAGNVWSSGYNQNYVYENSVSTGAAIGASSGGVGSMQSPFSIAIDASNYIWVPNNYDSNTLVGDTVSELTSLSTGSVYGAGGLFDPGSIAIDGAGNVWVISGNGVVTELNHSGTAVSPSVGYKSSTLTGGADVAIDASGNVWVAGTTLVEFVGAGTPVVTPLATAVTDHLLGSRPAPIV